MQQTHIITQYNGFALLKSVAIIEEIIPTIYEKKVIIPFKIGSLIGQVIIVQKLQPNEQIGNRKNPKTPMFIHINGKLRLLRVKYIPIAEIKDPNQMNLTDFKKHLYLSSNT